MGGRELAVFDYHGSKVRTVQIDGEVWFLGRDVCNVLELTNVTEALRGLDEDEKSQIKRTFITNESGSDLPIVSEPGLYNLISHSRKPAAKAFNRWIRHEVLPSIRKTGAYVGDPRKQWHEHGLMKMCDVAQVSFGVAQG